MTPFFYQNLMDRWVLEWMRFDGVLQRIEENNMLDPILFRSDGVARHHSTIAVLKHFRGGDVSGAQHTAIARCVCNLAIYMADHIRDGPDLTCALRDLLSARDNFIRASLE